MKSRQTKGGGDRAAKRVRHKGPEESRVAITTHTQKRSLLGLPVEIRAMIWDLVYQDERYELAMEGDGARLQVDWVDQWQRIDGRLKSIAKPVRRHPLGLPHACRLLYQEVHIHMLAKVELKFLSTEAFIVFSQKLDPVVSNMITSVIIEDPLPYGPPFQRKSISCRSRYEALRWAFSGMQNLTQATLLLVNDKWATVERGYLVQLILNVDHQLFSWLIIHAPIGTKARMHLQIPSPMRDYFWPGFSIRPMATLQHAEDWLKFWRERTGMDITFQGWAEPVNHTLE